LLWRSYGKKEGGKSFSSSTTQKMPFIIEINEVFPDRIREKDYGGKEGSGPSSTLTPKKIYKRRTSTARRNMYQTNKDIQRRVTGKV